MDGIRRADDSDVSRRDKHFFSAQEDESEYYYNNPYLNLLMGLMEFPRSAMSPQRANSGRRVCCSLTARHVKRLKSSPLQIVSVLFIVLESLIYKLPRSTQGKDDPIRRKINRPPSAHDARTRTRYAYCLAHVPLR